MKKLDSLKSLISTEDNLVKEYNNNINEYERNSATIDLSDGPLKEYYISENNHISLVNEELNSLILKIRQQIKKYFI